MIREIYPVTTLMETGASTRLKPEKEEKAPDDFTKEYQSKTGSLI